VRPPLPLRRAAAPLLLALAAACAPGDRERPAGEEPVPPLLVLAASDLQHALPEIAAAFQARTGYGVELVLGSTGNLTTQIENGAPGDVFLAANEPFVDRLARRGMIREETRAVYALGRLAVAWRAELPPPRDAAALAAETYRTVAIANPEHAPYGAAAREVLEAAGVWQALQGRLVLAENVAQATQFVRTGNADAGVVALPVMVGQDQVPFRPLDAALHAPLRQTGAVLRDARLPELAAAFLEELTGPGGREILGRYGFGAPDGP
jgi:molybdate transport system substrate-binding protein